MDRLAGVITQKHGAPSHSYDQLSFVSRFIHWLEFYGSDQSMYHFMRSWRWWKLDDAVMQINVFDERSYDMEYGWVVVYTVSRPMLVEVCVDGRCSQREWFYNKEF